MGDVLLFRPRNDKARRRAAPADGAAAQILFFTGVRYERQTDAPPTQTDLRPSDGSGTNGSPASGARRRSRRA